MTSSTFQLSPKEALDLAVNYHNSGKFSQAEEVYLQLLAGKLFVGKVSGLLGVLMFQLNRASEAKRYFEYSIETEPRDERTYDNYALTLEKQDDIDGAITVCQRGLDEIGQSISLRRKLSHYCVIKEKYKEAITYGEIVIQQDPNCFLTLSSLNAAYFFDQQPDRAIEIGYRILNLRDNRSPDLPTKPSTQKPSIRQTGQQIISFSLWGADPFYTQGAIHNAELAKKIYPDWICRFYCGRSTPSKIVDRLTDLGCQIVLKDEEEGFGGAVWRFLVADDPSVKRYLCRDADARLNLREKAAVDQWIESDKPFHIMRDAIVHCDLMLAGMWGGQGCILDGMESLLTRSFSNNSKFADQKFLAEQIWPLIKHQVHINDAFYDCFNAVPFPENTELKAPLHVGAGVAIDMDS